MPSESGAIHFTNEPKASPDILARILAKGGDPQPYRRLALDLLQHFGSLDALVHAGTQSPLTIPSLTAEHAALLKAIGDLVDLVGTNERKGNSSIIDSFEALGDYVQEHVRPPSIGASLRLIMVDRSHRVVGNVELQSSLGPLPMARTAVMEVLKHSAAGVLLLRVQASMTTDWANEFVETLEQIGDALGRLGVKLLDVALATPSGIDRLRAQPDREDEMM